MFDKMIMITTWGGGGWEVRIILSYKALKKFLQRKDCQWIGSSLCSLVDNDT
jgi:hypothetical protein